MERTTSLRCSSDGHPPGQESRASGVVTRVEGGLVIFSFSEATPRRSGYVSSTINPHNIFNSELLMKPKHLRPVLFLFMALLPIFCVASGLGSQSWGDGMDDDSGSSGLGLGDAAAVLIPSLACWWLVFSSRSPIKEKPVLQLFFLFLGPATVAGIVVMLKRLYLR